MINRIKVKDYKKDKINKLKGIGQQVNRNNCFKLIVIKYKKRLVANILKRMFKNKKRYLLKYRKYSRIKFHI